MQNLILVVYQKRKKKFKILEDRDWNIKGIYDIFNEII